MTTAETLRSSAQGYLIAHNTWEERFDPIFHSYMEYLIKCDDFSSYDSGRPYLVRAVTTEGILLWLPETSYSFETEITISNEFMDDPAKFHAEIDAEIEKERLEHADFSRRAATELVRELEEQLREAKKRAGIA